MVFKKSSRVPSGGASGKSNVSSVVPVSDGSRTSGNIKVVVRVRPESAMEAEGNKGTVVRILDEHVLIFDPKEESEPDYFHGKRRVMRDLNKKKKRDVRFAFDRVFGQNSSNQDMHDNTTKLILDGLLDGYNCSVFAYGATGAGKTFTMLGNYGSPGLTFLTMMELYRRMDEMKEDKTCDVAVSYLEVYNEQIRDLLVPGKFLPLREDPQKGVIITGLSLHKPSNAEELLHMLDFGNRNRTQHPTDANAESSRSHAVFQVFIRQRDRTAAMSAAVKVAKMSLIDLAGSERATVTTNRGARFREGANINKSLLALGNCINALAEGKSKGYVPYRNSKLTRLLKDSLGGNCRTVMIAAISPSTMSFEDTYNTLNYANRAKNIKADLKRNVLSVDFHISKYAKIVDELRLEVTELRAKLKLYEDGQISAPKPEETPKAIANKTELDRLKGDLVVVFEDRRSIRKEVMELEGSERDLELKVHTKSRSLGRVRTLNPNMGQQDKVAERISHSMESARRRMAKIAQRKTKFSARMDENERRLQRVQTSMGELDQDGLANELLESQLRNHHLEIELLDTKRHVKCLKKLCRFEETQAKNTEKIVSSLIKAYRKVFYILKGHDFATPDVLSEYSAVQQLIEGEREVAWADQSVGGGANDETLLLDNHTVAGNTEDDDGSPPHGDGFDINRLLAFPVLSTVSLLTHTPKKGGTPRTPQPQSPKLGKAHMTPISCMKKSNRTLLKPWSMKQELSSDISAPEVSTMSSTANVITTASSTTSSAEPPACGVTPPGIPVCGPPAANIPSKSSDDSAVLDATYNALDGIEVLQNTPCAKDFEKNSLARKNVAMDTTITLTPPRPPRAPVTDTKVTTVTTVTPRAPPPCVDNSTVTRPQIAGTPRFTAKPVTNSGTVTKNNGTVTKGNPPIQSGTVTKANPPVQSGTVTKGNPPVQSGTITRTRSGTVTKRRSDSSDEEGVRHSSVVRSMDFSDEGSATPGGKMTFAEVLKSPGRALSRPVAGSPCSDAEPIRSPLASRENLPSVTKHGRGAQELESNIPLKQRKVTSEVPRPSAISRGRQPATNATKRLTVSASSVRSRAAVDRTQQSLHRMGLPSALDKTGKDGLRSARAQVMRASSIKQRARRRSLSSEGLKESNLPRRVPNTSGQSSSKTLFRRSKSAALLPRKAFI